MMNLPIFYFASCLGSLIVLSSLAYAGPSVDAEARISAVVREGLICGKNFRNDDAKLAACVKSVNESALKWIDDLSTELSTTDRGRNITKQTRETIARAQLDWLKFYRAKCDLKRAFVITEHPPTVAEVAYQNCVHNLTQMRAQDLFSQMD